MSAGDVSDLLVCAVRKGDLRSVMSLIGSYGIPFCSKDGSQGYLLMFVAVTLGHVEVAKFLFKAGVKVECEVDGVADTLLHIAASRNNAELVRLLVENNAQVDACNGQNETALHLAAKNGSEEIVKTLLENKASVTVKTSNLKTPFDLAIEARHMEVADLIRYSAYPPLHAAIFSGSLTRVLQPLDEGADVNQCHSDRTTALHEACSKDSIEIVKILCEHGADVNARDFADRSPVHTAESGDVVEILCNYGANCDARAYDKTALHFFCSKYRLEFLGLDDETNKTITALINNGCDINAETEGKTALEMIWSHADAHRDELLHPRDGANPYDPFDHLDPEWQETVMILKKQALKLRAAGLHVNQKNLDVFESVNGRLADYAQACTEEFARVKDTKVQEFHLHSVLGNRNPLYSKDASLMEELLSCNFNEFPILRNLIINSIKKSPSRLKLIGFGVLVMRDIIKVSRK